MQHFLRSTYFKSIRPVYLALSFVYAVLFVLHGLSLSGSDRIIMMVFAGVSALFLISTYIASFRLYETLREYTIELSALVIIGIPIINTLVHIFLMPDGKQTTSFIIIILAASVVVLDTTWFLVMTILATVGWALILVPQLSLEDIIHYIIALAMTMVGAMAIQINRKNILSDLVMARKLQADRNRELQAAKKTLEENQQELERTVVSLKQAKRQTEEAMQAREQFLSNISHELRTPLNAVIGLTELLMLNDPRPDQKEDLEVLKFSGENLLGLISDVLDFTKMNVGELSLEAIPFDLREVIEQLERTHKFRASDKEIEFEVETIDLPENELIGDPLRLKQILNNLLSNAVKFTEHGKVSLKVVCTWPRDQMVDIHFSVTDTGIGIDNKQLQKIFEPFKQADSNTTRKFGGTGLGLAITQQLIEMHGTQMHVNSIPGTGTTFSFSLSLQVRDDAETSTVQSQPVDIDLSMKRILLVDDNNINLVVLNRMLQHWQAETDIATNGQEAMELAARNQYDLIFMDLHMPVMDGYDAAKLIRLKQPDLPIVALTASTLNDVIDRVYKCGMNDHMFKPFNQRELHDKLVKLFPIKNENG